MKSKNYYRSSDVRGCLSPATGIRGGLPAGDARLDREFMQYDPRYNYDAAAKRTSERSRMLLIKHREEREEGCAVKESVIPPTTSE